MKSVLTTPPEPYDFYKSFTKACHNTPYDPTRTFDWFFHHGFVIKSPDSLLLACADRDRDAWLVFWAEHLNPQHTLANIRFFLSVMPYWKPQVGWARLLKGRPRTRYYSTNRLLELTRNRA